MFSRGRSADPLIRCRMRWWTLRRILSFEISGIMSLPLLRIAPSYTIKLKFCLSFELSNLVIFNLVIEKQMLCQPPFSNYPFTKLPNYQILLRARFSDLLLQPLARVAHTLLLVRIRRTQGAHFRRHLSHFLPVNAAYRHLRLLGVNRHRNAGWQRVFNWVRIAQSEHNRVLALQLGAIADAYDLQIAVPALGHAFHCVVDQGARQAVNGSMIVILARHLNMTVLLLQLHALGQMRLHLAFGSLNHHGVSFSFKLHSRGERNRLFSDTRHFCNPFSGESLETIARSSSTTASLSALSHWPLAHSSFRFHRLLHRSPSKLKAKC